VYLFESNEKNISNLKIIHQSIPPHLHFRYKQYKRGPRALMSSPKYWHWHH